MKSTTTVHISSALLEQAKAEDKSFSHFIERLLTTYFANPEDRNINNLKVQISILQAKLKLHEEKVKAEGWEKV